MHRFVIERDIPDIGSAGSDELKGAAVAMIISATCLTGLYVFVILRTIKRVSPPEGASS